MSRFKAQPCQYLFTVLAGVIATQTSFATSNSVELNDSALDNLLAINTTSSSHSPMEPMDYTAQELTMLPSSLLALPLKTKNALVADLAKNRLYLYAHDQGELRLERKMYLSIGKAGYGKRVEGDNLSPVGIYTVTSWIPGENLPDLYGKGAWPVDYPNPLDKLEGRTGYGIWLHGNPSSTSGRRAPRSSEGCITLANADLLSLAPFIELQTTPVIFADKIRWQSSERRIESAMDAREMLEKWIRSWESKDTDAFVANYSDKAKIGTLSKEQLRQQKHDVNSRKEWIRVDITELTVLAYPGEGAPRLQIDFLQDYRSSNYRGKSYKRQYWEKNAKGQWQIILEVPNYSPI